MKLVGFIFRSRRGNYKNTKAIFRMKKDDPFTEIYLTEGKRYYLPEDIVSHLERAVMFENKRSVNAYQILREITAPAVCTRD